MQTNRLIVLLILAVSVATGDAIGQIIPTNELAHGATLFQQNCAVCHGARQGPGSAFIPGQGPTLIGVVGRRAGSSPNFNYTTALTQSGLVWDPATLDRFLTNPIAAVPGTAMIVYVPSPVDRHDSDRLSLHPDQPRPRSCPRRRPPACLNWMLTTGTMTRPASNITLTWRRCQPPL